MRVYILTLHVLKDACAIIFFLWAINFLIAFQDKRNLSCFFLFLFFLLLLFFYKNKCLYSDICFDIFFRLCIFINL